MTLSTPQRRHFHRPGRELLLPAPQPCPFLPELTLDGLAVTPEGGHHMILTLAGKDRAYFGPDDATVASRIGILTAALHQGAADLEPHHTALVGEWVVLAWESVLDELVDVLSKPALAPL